MLLLLPDIIVLQPLVHKERVEHNLEIIELEFRTPLQASIRFMIENIIKYNP